MKKIKFCIWKLIILVLPLASYNFCFAQTETPPEEKLNRASISIALGVGLPVGSFKPPGSSYDRLTGLAETGFTGNLGFGYLFGKHFGMAASVYGGSFAAEEMQEMGQTYYDGRWNATGLLIGAMYEFSKKKFRFGFKLMAGAQLAFCPETQLTTVSYMWDGFNETTYTSTFYRPTISAVDFAFGGGAYLGYNFTDKLSLNLAFDFSEANHRFTDEDVEIATIKTYGNGTGEGPAYEKYPANFVQEVSFVSITLGIVYYF